MPIFYGRIEVNETLAKVQSIIAPTLRLLGYELWGCELLAQGDGLKLTVYIDQPDGIRLADCERASKQISALLDVEDPFVEAYTLEVSSPGLNRALFTAEHYGRYVGHKVKLRLKDLVNNRRNFTGMIQAVTDTTVTICVDEQDFTLDLANIDKANLVSEY